MRSSLRPALVSIGLNLFMAGAFASAALSAGPMIDPTRRYRSPREAYLSMPHDPMHDPRHARRQRKLQRARWRQ